MRLVDWKLLKRAGWRRVTLELAPDNWAELERAFWFSQWATRTPTGRAFRMIEYGKSRGAESERFWRELAEQPPPAFTLAQFCQHVVKTAVETLHRETSFQQRAWIWFQRRGVR